MTTDDEFGYVPKQKRSEETREKIIATGAKLFSENGYHATSSKRITREAGVATGSFYNYFSDKKQLLFEIYRRHAQKIHSMIVGSLSEYLATGNKTDSREFIRQIIEQVMRMHDFSPDFHREITSLMHSDPDFAQVRKQEEEEAIQMLIALLEPQRKQLRITDLKTSATIVGLTIETVVHSLKMFGSPQDEPRILEALIDMIHRFLYKH